MTTHTSTINSNGKPDSADLKFNIPEKLNLISVNEASLKHNISRDTIKRWINKDPEIVEKIKARQVGKGSTAPWFVDDTAFSEYMEEHKQTSQFQQDNKSTHNNVQDSWQIKSLEDHIVSLKTNLEASNIRLQAMDEQLKAKDGQINNLINKQENFQQIISSMANFRNLLDERQKVLEQMPFKGEIVEPLVQEPIDFLKTPKNENKEVKVEKPRFFSKLFGKR
jgi:hypothetical protein